MTWPAISALIKKMETHPPLDFIAAAFLEAKKPKPLGEALKKSGLPIRKGKVKQWPPKPVK